jgi:hypothetical protein
MDTLQQESDSKQPTLHSGDSVRNETPDLEKQATNQSAETQATVTELYPVTDLSRGIVGWDGQDDPENPQNFPDGKKWTLLALISAMTLISPLASSMFSPAISYMAREFLVSDKTLLSFSVSIYLLGYTVSPNAPHRLRNTFI